MRPLAHGHIRIKVTAEEDQRIRGLFDRIAGHSPATSTELNAFAGALLLGAVIELERDLGVQLSLLQPQEQHEK